MSISVFCLQKKESSNSNNKMPLVCPSSLNMQCDEERSFCLFHHNNAIHKPHFNHLVNV